MEAGHELGRPQRTLSLSRPGGLTRVARVADCLYWMARYIERAENIARYVDVNLQVGLDRAGSGQWLPLVAAAGDEALFRERHGDGLPEDRAKDAVLHFLTFDPEYPNSILPCVCLARRMPGRRGDT